MEIGCSDILKSEKWLKRICESQANPSPSFDTDDKLTTRRKIIHDNKMKTRIKLTSDNKMATRIKQYLTTNWQRV